MRFHSHNSYRKSAAAHRLTQFIFRLLHSPNIYFIKRWWIFNYHFMRNKNKWPSSLQCLFTFNNDRRIFAFKYNSFSKHTHPKWTMQKKKKMKSISCAFCIATSIYVHRRGEKKYKAKNLHKNMTDYNLRAQKLTIFLINWFKNTF